MALIVEDGTIVAGADSYRSLVDAATYHAAMGHTAWASVAYSDSDREAAMRRAVVEMEARYLGLWSGTKRNDSETVTYQQRAWPRTGVLDEDGVELDDQVIPVVVPNAQCEIALIILTGGSFLVQEVSAEEQSISSESVGPISISYGRAGGTYTSSFPLIDRMLAGVCRTAPSALSMTVGLTDDEIADMAEDAADPYDSTTWPG